jgi:hypothetical protein
VFYLSIIIYNPIPYSLWNSNLNFLIISFRTWVCPSFLSEPFLPLGSLRSLRSLARIPQKKRKVKIEDKKLALSLYSVTPSIGLSLASSFSELPSLLKGKGSLKQVFLTSGPFLLLSLLLRGVRDGKIS